MKNILILNFLLSLNLLSYETPSSYYEISSIKELENVDITKFVMKHSKPKNKNSGISFKECKMRVWSDNSTSIAAEIRYSDTKIFEYRVIPDFTDFNIIFGNRLITHLVRNGLCGKNTPREKRSLFHEIQDKHIILTSTDEQLISMAKKKAPLITLNNFFTGIYYKSCRFVYTRYEDSSSSARQSEPDYGKHSAQIDINGITSKEIYYKSDSKLAELVTSFRDLVGHGTACK